MQLGGKCGKPKGIVISHRNFIDSARVVSQYLDLKENDVISGTLIFNLDYGLNQLFCTLYKRATLALHRFILAGDFQVLNYFQKLEFLLHQVEM